MKNYQKLAGMLALLLIAPLVLANQGSRSLNTIETDHPASPRIESIILDYSQPVDNENVPSQ